MDSTVLIMQEKVGFKTKNGILFKRLNDILICEADTNYTIIYFKNSNDKLIVCKSLKDVEKLLPKRFFIRTHRSWLINIENVKEFVSSKNIILMK